MALDDKSAPFAYHRVIHMSPQTQTEGVSGTSQSYLSFRASQNSLLFMHLSMLSLRGGRAWGGDLTFFKNLPSNSLPTGKSFQSIATKFPHKESRFYKLYTVIVANVSHTLINCTCKNLLGFSLLPFTLIPQYLKRFNCSVQ